MSYFCSRRKNFSCFFKRQFPSWAWQWLDQQIALSEIITNQRRIGGEVQPNKSNWMYFLPRCQDCKIAMCHVLTDILNKINWMYFLPRLPRSQDCQNHLLTDVLSTNIFHIDQIEWITRENPKRHIHIPMSVWQYGNFNQMIQDSY